MIARKLIKEATVHNWVASLNYHTVKNSINGLQATLAVENTIQSQKMLDDKVKNTIKNFTQDYQDINTKTAIEIIVAICKNFDTNAKFELDLINLKEFENICNVILKNARSLNTYDQINILQKLLFLKVPSNSIIIETLLQLIRVSLNNLSVGEIMLLYNILYRTEETHLSVSLLEALPQAFKIQAEIELDSDSTNIYKALKFCTDIKDLETTNRIIHILLNSERGKDLNCLINIFCAIWTLLKLEPSFKKILFFLKFELMARSKELNFNQIEYLLYLMSKGIIHEEFHLAPLIDKLSSVALTSKPTLKETSMILKYLNRMLYTNIPLLNYLVDAYTTDASALREFSIKHLNLLIKGLTIADYKPSNLETITKMLKNTVTDNNCRIQDLIILVFQLLSLNFYCSELIEKVFIEVNNDYQIIIEQHVISTILKLYWCVKLLYPHYKGVMLDENILNQLEIKCKSYNKTYLKKESLKKATGDDKYIKTGLKTKLGGFVDHVIVVQADDSLMDISNYNVTFVEELASLSECSKILFFGLPKTQYSINNGNMLSTIKIQLKAIETLSGFYPFVINLNLWKNFSDEQQILHLQKAIKLKCTNIQNK